MKKHNKMKDYLEFETTPFNEPCSQIGDEEYTRDSILECRVLQRQIIRTVGEPPEGSHFYRRSCPHDFGTYHELALSFDDNDESHTEYMQSVERNFPANWDEQSLRELKEGDYSLITIHQKTI